MPFLKILESLMQSLEMQFWPSFSSFGPKKSNKFKQPGLSQFSIYIYVALAAKFESVPLFMGFASPTKFPLQ